MRSVSSECEGDCALGLGRIVDSGYCMCSCLICDGPVPCMRVFQPARSGCNGCGVFRVEPYGAPPGVTGCRRGWCEFALGSGIVRTWREWIGLWGLATDDLLLRCCGESMLQIARLALGDL